MEKYYLELAGLRIVLQTPWKITISHRMRSFVCSPHSQWDCRIDLCPCEHLPEMGQSGHWDGMAWYERHRSGLRIFHCHQAGGTAFAVTQLQTDGNVTVLVQACHERYFDGTAGIFNRIAPEALLLQHGGLLLHGALVRCRGMGVVFSGPSGVGKSTQAALWQQYAGAEILNGDRTVLRCKEGAWTGYGSPYAGTSGIYRNENAPVQALVILRQAEENRLEQITPAQALRYCWPELSVHRWDQNFVEKSMDLFLRFAQQISIYVLSCRPDREAVMLLKKELTL